MKHLYCIIAIAGHCAFTHSSETQVLPPHISQWQEDIARHRTSIGETAHTLIKKQQQAYAQGEAPKIADPAIKSIPIIESHEPLVDVTTINDPRITMLPAPTKPFASPDCHSGFAASSTMRRSLFEKLQTTIKELDLLAVTFGYQPGQIDIKVFEGLRDLTTQQMLFDNKAKEIHTEKPHLSDDEVYNETCRWVSPTRNNVPVHSTGAAVDIRLWDNKAQAFVDVGSFGVIWGPNTNAPTFSENITDTQRRNRLYLMAAIVRAGLINYLHEHWHISDGDRYERYWHEPHAEKRVAIYGAV